MRSSAHLLRAALHTSAALRADAAAAPAAGAGKVMLNLSVPHLAIHKAKPFGLVTLPGVVGEFGITAGHTPIVAELKSGLVKLFNNQGDTEAVEQYFVSGGFAALHQNNSADVTVVECVKLSDLDPEAARKGRSDAKARMEAASPDSLERAEAQINYEVYSAMCSALGVAA